MRYLTLGRKGSIILTGILFIIILIFQIIFILNDSEISIPLLLLHITILYGIFLPFSILRIKWIRKTTTALGVLFFFGYLFSLYEMDEWIFDKKDIKHYICGIISIIFIFNIYNILYAYWGINIFKQNNNS